MADANEVHAIGVDGRRRLLDKGPGIDPSSLALNSRQTRVAWTDGGTARSAALK